MGRQRNMSLVKEQDKKKFQKKMNEMKASIPPNTEFKTLVVRIFKELRTSIKIELNIKRT